MFIPAAISSFALSVASNVVYSLFARTDTEKEIRSAFQEAIDEWCPNEDIRRCREPVVWSFVQKYVSNPTVDPQGLSLEEQEFLSVFQKKIAAHPSAYSYLSSITGREYYDAVMTGLQIVQTKLDGLARKLESFDTRHDELHAEAIVEINTVLNEAVEGPVNVFLFGIVSAFDEDIYAYTKPLGKNIRVIIDKDSRLKREDGDFYRPKFTNFDYDWEKENRPDWTQIDPDVHFYDLFSHSYMATFQLMGIDFLEGVGMIQEILERNSVNEQLSVEEKRCLSYIVQQMRAVQSVIDNNHNVFIKMTDSHFVNLEVQRTSKYSENGVALGNYVILYKDSEYVEPITEVVSPVRLSGSLLDVVVINPEFYFKLTGYLGGLFNSVRNWWQLSGGGFLRGDSDQESQSNEY